MGSGNNKVTIDFDFGFSAVTEDELKQYEKQQIQHLATQAKQTSAEANTYKERLDVMYKMIVPLIVNLSKDPEKELLLFFFLLTLTTYVLLNIECNLMILFLTLLVRLFFFSNLNWNSIAMYLFRFFRWAWHSWHAYNTYLHIS